MTASECSLSTTRDAIGGIWVDSGFTAVRVVMSFTSRLLLGSPGTMRFWPNHVGVFTTLPTVVFSDSNPETLLPSSSVGSRRRRIVAPYAVEFVLPLWQVVPQLM